VLSRVVAEHEEGFNYRSRDALVVEGDEIGREEDAQ
jgi:hypothetical protein